MRIDRREPPDIPAEFVDGFWKVETEAEVVDVPTFPATVRAETDALLRSPVAGGERRVVLLARDDTGAPAGSAWVSFPEPPNDRGIFVNVTVRPALRRRGIGSTLLAAALELSADSGRDQVWSDFAAGTAGEGFAAAAGFVETLREPVSVLRLSDVDPSLLAGVDPRRSGDYRLVRSLGRIPDEYAGSYAAVKREMADAPQGDSGWETPPWDVAKLREAEDHARACGKELYRVIAVAPDGVVAGLTEVDVTTCAPTRAGQEDTIVSAAHRGHRLGLAMKLDMVGWLCAERPEVRETATWNAEANSHMRAINERLGARVDVWWSDVKAERSKIRWYHGAGRR